MSVDYIPQTENTGQAEEKTRKHLFWNVGRDPEEKKQQRKPLPESQWMEKRQNRRISPKMKKLLPM